MPAWCFKCQALVDARAGACSVCGGPISDLVSGGRRDSGTGSSLAQFFSRQYGVPEISLEQALISGDVLALVSKDVALRYCLIPVRRGAASSLVVAMADPTNIDALRALTALTRLPIEVVVADRASIEVAIEWCYRDLG